MTNVLPWTPEPSDRAAAAARVVASIRQQVQKLNNDALANFVSAARSWEEAAQHSQAIGAPIPVKPQPPLSWLVNVDTNGDMAVVSGPPLAPLVPDIPPPSPKPSGMVVSIGVKLYGSYYQAKADDTAPAGHVATANGSRYQKILNPWGGYWFRLD